jgi:hypothetical protein
MTASDWLTIAQIFNNVAVGVAAIAAASVGVPALRRLLNVRSMRKQYPLDEQGKTWELITVEGGAGSVYLHDKQLNVARHIANPATFLDVGFDWNRVRRLSRAEFDNIVLKYPINTERKF